MSDIHLGQSHKGSGTRCQVQPEILEAPAASGSEEWLYLQHKLSSTVPQFLFLTLLSFTPSTRKFTLKNIFQLLLFLGWQSLRAARDILPPSHPNSA